MALLYVTKTSNLAICAFLVLLENKKQLKTKRIVLKRVSQRFVESCGFSPGTPVSSHKEYCRVAWILKIRLTLRKLFIRPVQGFLHLDEVNI